METGRFQSKSCASVRQSTHFKKRNFHFKSERSPSPVQVILLTASLPLRAAGDCLLGLKGQDGLISLHKKAKHYNSPDLNKFNLNVSMVQV